jgi:hypothetical protein
MADVAQILCERVAFLHHMYIVCLYLKGNRDLYLHLLMFTKQAAIYSSCLFKWRLLTEVIIYRSRWPVQGTRHCHVRLPVSDISKSLPHSLVNCQADCGTVGHFCFIARSIVLNKQLSNMHIFTALSYFAMYQHILCQYKHRTYLHISCPVWF